MIIFKYLKNILLLKQVADAYKEEKGKDKPVYLSRRFVGVLITAASAFVLYRHGVSLDLDADKLAETLTSTAGGLTALYGIVMAVIGQLKREKTPSNK